MRKLKLFLLLFVAASSIYSLTACKDKDDDQPNIPAEIIGTWVCAAELETLTYTFGADGKFIETWASQTQSESDYGTFTYDGTTLTLKYDDGEVASGPIIISGNTLTMDDLVVSKK